MNSINVLSADGSQRQPVHITKLVGEGITVFMRGRASEYDAFRFKVTAAGTIAGTDFIDGYDDECLNMRIEAKDIEYVKKGRATA